jgi:hypothetical protein
MKETIIQLFKREELKRGERTTWNLYCDFTQNIISGHPSALMYHPLIHVRI